MFFGRHTQTIIAPSVISIMLSPQQEINYATKWRNCQTVYGVHAYSLVDPQMPSSSFVGLIKAACPNPLFSILLVRCRENYVK